MLSELNILDLLCGWNFFLAPLDKGHFITAFFKQDQYEQQPERAINSGPPHDLKCGGPFRNYRNVQKARLVVSQNRHRKVRRVVAL